jgi:hypothetical protein
VSELNALDQRFTNLLAGYRAAGGLARDSEIVPRAADRHPGGCVWLSRQIAGRGLLFFTWQEALWFPVFQFEKADMSLRRPVARIAAELAGWMDDWERVQWFVQPHCALGDRTPLELFDAQADRVMEAARMERFLQNA